VLELVQCSHFTVTTIGMHFYATLKTRDVLFSVGCVQFFQISNSRYFSTHVQ